MFTAVWRKLRASKQRKVDYVCKRAFFVTLDVLFLHKYAWEGSGCETECVWGTCVDLSPGYLYHSSCWVEVESIKAATRRTVTVCVG